MTFFKVLACAVLVACVASNPAPDHPHPAPAYGYEDPIVPPVYDFQYGVNDANYGPVFSHAENRNNYDTAGEYRVNLPDGRVQIVSYKAGPEGYVADVKYEGEAAYPDTPAYKPAPAPYKPAPAPYEPAPAPYKPAPAPYQPAPAPYKPAPAPYQPAPTPYKPAPAPYHPAPAPYHPAPAPYHPAPYHPAPAPYHPAPAPYKPRTYSFKPVTEAAPAPVVEVAAVEEVAEEVAPTVASE